MQEAVLSVENLHKTFINGSNSLKILRNITVAFKQKSSYAIMGISGSGKSTFMHLLACLDTPTAGSVYFNDDNIGHMNSKDKDRFLQNSIGLVFQLPYLIGELSVLENIMIRGLVADMTPDQCRARSMELLDAVGIPDKAESKPLSLSGGQQQRVALARALFCRPAFLIADEPTGSLDEHTTQDIIELILICQREWGMGIIMSTHDSSVAMRMQTIYQLKDGMMTLKIS